jgi:NAD(P)-dependent dehydrogenase (short-subunit alcohol dehydrogenase family)
MDLKLKDKVVVVTGASAGIGKAVAQAAAVEGARVVLCARRADTLEAAAKDLAAGARILRVAADLATVAGARELRDRTLSEFGTAHVVVNNVGILGRFAPFMELTDDEWQDNFNANVMSAVRVSRAFIPAMQKQRWGRIIHLSSESGLQPDAEMPHYSITKAALLNLAKSMSKAFARDNILVNAVSPAFVMSPMVRGMIEQIAGQKNISFDDAVASFLAANRPHIELKRPGAPEEVAAAVLFLASEAAGFITGTNLRVDGGSVASI